uniref:GtrA family protein n=1 Tax=Prevotella sp. GTC17254 TaxID=3236794 RepID=A0AB33IVH1_9BACT
MKRIFGIFRIKPEERWPAFFVFLTTLLLNALVIVKYADRFLFPAKDYHHLFVSNFHVSGYDPLTYAVLSQWFTEYNIYRHPLLAFFLYLPAQFNKALISLTGINCAPFIVAVFLLLTAVYSFVFLYRILREVIALPRFDATLLSLMLFSFAYVLVSVCVPDHFALSMGMLLLTLYVSGKKLRQGKPFTKWQTILFFLVTAGISLNNGLKVFMANWFVNGRRFFRPLNLILAILLPSVLIWVFARMEYREYQYPRWKARKVAQKRAKDRDRAQLAAQFTKAWPAWDSARVARAADSVMKVRTLEKKRANAKKPNVAHQGKPVKKGEFWSWTDITTSRTATAVENLFGESILLHQDYLLGDTLTGRPVIVGYRWWLNYVVEVVLVACLLLGLWVGRRSRLMWLSVSFFALDMAIHMVAGFGINEVYIMSPHWAFVFPIVLACLLKGVPRQVARPLRGLLGLTAAYCFVYNMTLLIEYLAFS